MSAGPCIKSRGRRSPLSTMAEPRSRVLVDPETGNVLIVHRRSIGTGTILFFLALVSLIAGE